MKLLDYFLLSVCHSIWAEDNSIVVTLNENNVECKATDDEGMASAETIRIALNLIVCVTEPGGLTAIVSVVLTSRAIFQRTKNYTIHLSL